MLSIGLLFLIVCICQYFCYVIIYLVVYKKSRHSSWCFETTSWIVFTIVARRRDWCTYAIDSMSIVEHIARRFSFFTFYFFFFLLIVHFDFFSCFEIGWCTSSSFICGEKRSSVVTIGRFIAQRCVASVVQQRSSRENKTINLSLSHFILVNHHHRHRHLY